MTIETNTRLVALQTEVAHAKVLRQARTVKHGYTIAEFVQSETSPAHYMLTPEARAVYELGLQDSEPPSDSEVLRVFAAFFAAQ